MTTALTPTRLSVKTTVLTLDIEHPATRTIITDVHKAHRLTMSGFAHLLQQYDFFTGINGGHPDHRRALNVLYAVNVRRHDGAVMIRLQADAMPRFDNPDCHWWREALMEEPITRDWAIPSIGEIAYQIRANPVTRINGKRRSINDPDKQLQWWTDRAAAAGLTLNGEPLVDEPVTFVAPSKNHGDPNKAEFGMTTLRYTGTATIADPDAYQVAVQRGIGRGLSYGAGMLLTTSRR